MSINLTDEIEVKTKKGKLGAAKQIFLEGDTQTVEKEIQNINSRHNDLSSKHESLNSMVSEHTKQIESNQSQITANKSAQDAKNASLDANMAKLNARDDQITELVKGVTATGGASVATAVTYDNEKSSLTAVNAQAAIDELSSIIIYDVSAHNNGAVFESLQALLSSSNLSTLIPISVRRGGITIRFIQGSISNHNNKYVQYILTNQSWSIDVDDWKEIGSAEFSTGEKVSDVGIDIEPTAGSNNLVTSGAMANVKIKTDYLHYVNENGLFVADENGNVVMMYNENGLDVTKLSNHLQSLVKLIPGFLKLGETSTTAFAGDKGKELEDSLAELITKLGIVDTMEDGLYFIDEDLYVCASVDKQGFHASNILEYEIN